MGGFGAVLVLGWALVFVAMTWYAASEVAGVIRAKDEDKWMFDWEKAVGLFVLSLVFFLGSLLLVL